MLNLRPEEELLLQCLRTSIDENTCQRIQSLLGTDVDWANFLQMAIRHSVAPLLYRKLYPRFQADIPEHILNRLRKLYFANLIRNALLTRELLRLSKLLEEAGIASIAFKGPVLASAVYGDIGLRGFDDLDIMVPREHMAQAKRLLYNEGYRLLFPVHA